MVEHTAVGDKITTLRKSLSLSIEELAERCDCDAATIEQLEAGSIAPSLAPLIKITRALGVRLGTLLDDDSHLGPVITRRDAASSVARTHDLETGIGTGTLDFFSLAEGKATRHMEPFMITVNPSTEKQLSAHEGEEFIYVLEGTIEVEYGKDTHVLAVGDSIYLDSIVPHQVRGASPSPARILAVVYAPF
ncbi:MAG: DNA-binding protein [Actinobacteria bacterium HGW-Actinobacteria-7]|jgi:transcriptional regulator with XRE-family HTH domain|nr:MAG: DNA-binding protein [Actinobacteria bacterium HGW-Actinobacteria-7]